MNYITKHSRAHAGDGHALRLALARVVHLRLDKEAD